MSTPTLPGDLCRNLTVRQHHSRSFFICSTRLLRAQLAEESFLWFLVTQGGGRAEDKNWLQGGVREKMEFHRRFGGLGMRREEASELGLGVQSRLSGGELETTFHLLHWLVTVTAPSAFPQTLQDEFRRQS